MAVSYQLQSEDYQVFYNRSLSSFIIIRDYCTECKTAWNHSINQCIFCGTENYYLWICNQCRKLRSLQNSNPSNRCDCGGEYLKSCFNDDCDTNKDLKLKNILSKSSKFSDHSKNGIFNKSAQTRSGFTISQHYCLKCGHEKNKSKIWKLKVLPDINPDNQKVLFNDFDFIIVVKNNQKEFQTISKNNLNPNTINKVDTTLFVI